MSDKEGILRWQSSGRPQRSAATSRFSAGMPRSDRTQRTSDLVATQMKVSSGVGPNSGVSRNSTNASSRRSKPCTSAADRGTGLAGAASSGNLSLKAVRVCPFLCRARFLVVVWFAVRPGFWAGGNILLSLCSNACFGVTARVLWRSPADSDSVSRGSNPRPPAS